VYKKPDSLKVISIVKGSSSNLSLLMGASVRVARVLLAGKETLPPVLVKVWLSITV
jgi:hypothetical protein